MFHLTQIDHVALAVSDPLKSAHWYHSVLGLERRHQAVWGDHPVMMCIGNTCVALFPAGTSQPAPTAGLAMRHLAFRADRQNFSLAQATLRRLEIPFDFQDHQIAHSIYFRDPDGYSLEITTYDLITQPL
jgi:catechol 2,3-dioxygenase-like lactoylglutathione lyase family enzyme